MIDEPQTVFNLLPTNQFAREIVDDPANSALRREDPNDPARSWLRIGLERQSKVAPYLAKFGRITSTCDVILGKRWSKNDQCYFDFNQSSGELILHDISKNSSTTLSNKKYPNTMWKIPRQCVVLLDLEWIFQMGCASFHLIPRKPPNHQAGASFTEKILEYAHKSVPEELEGTYEGTMERLWNDHMQGLPGETNTIINARDIRAMQFNPTNPDHKIRYAHVQVLGNGGQGNVDEIVDLHDGEHYACKTLTIEPFLQLENEFKHKIKREVELVKKIKHSHVVPYLFHQGWEAGRDIELFMPVFEGSLSKLIDNFRDQDIMKTITETMVSQVLSALNHLHNLNPPVIHRDIKPQNILYRGDNYYLADFGVAKPVDESKTLVGTQFYLAPEIWKGQAQTTKVDIYSLGVTIFDCWEKFPPPSERESKWPTFLEWHKHLKKIAEKYSMISVLADDASSRPTAEQLLDALHKKPLQPIYRSAHKNPYPGQEIQKAPAVSKAGSEMDWTRRLHSTIAMSIEVERMRTKKGNNKGENSQNRASKRGRRSANSQYAGVSKRSAPKRNGKKQSK